LCAACSHMNGNQAGEFFSFLAGARCLRSSSAAAVIDLSRGTKLVTENVC
jgi:hypothetical protein